MRQGPAALSPAGDSRASDPVSPVLARPQTTDDFFRLSGDPMRVHAGRSVVTLMLEGRRHFLKRYWLTPSQLFKRHVARGLHELRMIDWLNAHGLCGPVVVRRGRRGLGPVTTGLFFLMEEVPGDVALEAAWRRAPHEAEELLGALATFTAQLHDAGFIHTDFSERHILVAGVASAQRFRLIDVERADVGRATDERCAADLATLVASVADERLRRCIGDVMIPRYVELRGKLSAPAAFMAAFQRARPTRSF